MDGSKISNPHAEITLPDFEVDYMRMAFEKEMTEKDEALSQMGNAISQKDDEIRSLKSLLKENGIGY